MTELHQPYGLTGSIQRSHQPMDVTYFLAIEKRQDHGSSYWSKGPERIAGH